MLLNYHIGRLVLSSLCVGDLVRLVLSGASFAGCSLQNEVCLSLHVGLSKVVGARDFLSGLPRLQLFAPHTQNSD